MYLSSDLIDRHSVFASWIAELLDRVVDIICICRTVALAETAGRIPGGQLSNTNGLGEESPGSAIGALVEAPSRTAVSARARAASFRINCLKLS